MGQGVKKDFNEAVKWYRKYAEQATASDIYANAMGFEKGEYGLIDNVVAYMWYNVAAIKGETKAKTARDLLAKKMTRAQITKALEFSKELLKK